MKGLFIPEITAEMFRNGCLESIEALMAEGEICDIDYEPEPRWIPVTERLPEEKQVKSVPSVDAVEVIRCQDCIWWDTKHPYGTLVPNAYHCKANDRFYSAEHFCAYGRRKEDET